MKYQNQDVNITILKNRDSVALKKAIDEITQDIVEIQYATSQIEPYITEYSALVIVRV